MSQIPNIIHFINLGPREFTLLHFLSIYSAYTVNNPNKIYVYCDHDQENNFYWDILTKNNIITIEKVSGTEYHKGIHLDSYQYRADVLRLEKLIERGGIYMDLDILCIKPLAQYLITDNVDSIVLGVESSQDPDDTNLDTINSITNAIIMTHPNNKFLIDWYDQIAENLFDKPWAYHAVALPKEILKAKKSIGEPYDVVILARKIIMPFDFRDTYFLDDDEASRSRVYLLNEACTVHMWETIWAMDNRLNFDVKYFNDNNNIFVNYFHKYLAILKNNMHMLSNIIYDLYNKKIGAKKLLNYVTMYMHLCSRFDLIAPSTILYYGNCASSTITGNNKITELREVTQNNSGMKRSVAILKYVNDQKPSYKFTANDTNFKIIGTTPIPSIMYDFHKDQNLESTNSEQTNLLVTYDMHYEVNEKHARRRKSLIKNISSVSILINALPVENESIKVNNISGKTKGYISSRSLITVNKGDMISLGITNTDDNEKLSNDKINENVITFNLQMEII